MQHFQAVVCFRFWDLRELTVTAKTLATKWKPGYRSDDFRRHGVEIREQLTQPRFDEYAMPWRYAAGIKR